MVRQIGVDEMRQSIRSVVEAHPEIQLVCLFGSRARNQAISRSDYDLAMVLDPVPEPLDYKFDLLCELMGALRTDAVDLVFVHEAPPLLNMLIYRDAQILYEASPDVWPRFAVQALREYEDTKPLRAIQYEYLIKRLKAERVHK